MASYTFYNVKARAKEDVDESQVKKTTYTNSKTGRISYALRAKGADGTNMTKFIKKDLFDELEVPTE
ncbi:hypothetical protein COY62_03675 [bacterium (Candidatus Howlettbacteria) CG_4_10_14_0_8_um_filter_40_9]|nr:MAG: hypothetical protein COY62_03675 [bacterium (Candidatus Howlettbacteria) CG_4_10_14_0_8_um_filter_40_9]